MILSMGLVDTPVKLINNYYGALIGMAHFITPLITLTLASVIQSIPRNLELAAYSLGCPQYRTFFRVIFPLSLTGFLSACLMGFSLCAGLFATPALLGGGRVITMSVLIYQQAVEIFNLPLAAVLSIILLITVLILNIIATKISMKGMKSRFQEM
jgi:putative spermidine/putrescine transport system permease protein